VELQQLRYVVALAEASSFTRAAAVCFVAQSALSHAIKSLENELGVALFSRTSRRVELTTAGRAFLPAARISLNAAERAAIDAAAAAGQVRGSLSVGVIPTVTAVNVSASLKRFRRAHPAARIALQVAGSDQIESAITRGDIDVGFLGLPESRLPRRVAYRHLRSDPLVAVVGNEHPLADRDEIQLKDLAQETFADFPTGTSARAESDLAFAAAGIHRNVAFESMATELTIDIVRQDLAVTLLPSRFAPQNADLTSLRIRGGPSRVEYVAWSDFNPSPAALAFLKIIELTD
jgi:DNA-binding transcriptional LysR family regulator